MQLIEALKHKVGNGIAYHENVKATLYLQPTIEEDEIAAIEAAVGFSFPELLKNLYRRIGNGGFGPGYGILGLGEHGWQAYSFGTADSLYQQFHEGDPEDPLWNWPEGSGLFVIGAVRCIPA